MLKGVAAYLGARLFKVEAAVAGEAAFLLAGAGEFAFVILGLAGRARLSTVIRCGSRSLPRRFRCSRFRCSPSPDAIPRRRSRRDS